MAKKTFLEKYKDNGAFVYKLPDNDIIIVFQNNGMEELHILDSEVARSCIVIGIKSLKKILIKIKRIPKKYK